MKKILFAFFIILLGFAGLSPAVATHDLATLEKKIEQQKKAAPLKKTAKPIKTTPVPVKKSIPKISPAPSAAKKISQPVKKVSQKNATTTTKKGTSVKKAETKKQIETPKKTSTPVAPKELSGEVVEVKTKPVQDTKPPSQKQPIDQTLSTKKNFLEETILHSKFIKTQADSLMAKIQQNPGSPEYLEMLRKQNGIPELQEQFKKLQEQIDAIEKEIRAIPQNTINTDISKTLALQKTKFPLLQQQESLLQQIELKENFVKQTIDSTKKEYDFNSQLYNTLAQKYLNEQALIQKLQNEIDVLQKNEPQKQQNAKTT